MNRPGGKKEKSQGPGKKPKGPHDKKEKPGKKPKPKGPGGKKEKPQGPGKKPKGPGGKKEKSDTKKNKPNNRPGVKLDLSNNNGQKCPTACVEEVFNGVKTGRQTCCGQCAAWANKCKKYTRFQARLEGKPHSWMEGVKACQ